MRRATILFVVILLASALLPGAVSASGPAFTPGASGAGDPYFPLDGNGGYDVKHYDLDLRYDPDDRHPGGTATIDARATQNLSRFNLDLVGLTVRSIKVDGRSATWTRDGRRAGHHAATGASPRAPASRSSCATTACPELDDRPVRRDVRVHPHRRRRRRRRPAARRGDVVPGQRPSDRQGVLHDSTSPSRRASQVVANGRLVGTRRGTAGRPGRGTPRSRWPRTSPRVDIGKFEITSHRRTASATGTPSTRDLLPAVGDARSGKQFAYSQAGRLVQAADADHRRPGGGATLSFWVNRETEEPGTTSSSRPGPPGTRRLDDAAGHQRPHVRKAGTVPVLAGAMHPFLTHYQTARTRRACRPSRGTSGDWNAATGTSDGWERWSIDLGAYAGATVEVSITYVSDDVVQVAGVFVDDIEVSTGAGSDRRSRGRRRARRLDGARRSGRLAEPNDNDWIVGPRGHRPAEPGGRTSQASFARQPEIIDVPAPTVRPVPVHDGRRHRRRLRGPRLRPRDPDPARLLDATSSSYAGRRRRRRRPRARAPVVRRQPGRRRAGSDIWLNEGFATYAEWLWSEQEGSTAPQAIFDFYDQAIPPDDPFWALTIGDPGAGTDCSTSPSTPGAP